MNINQNAKLVYDSIYSYDISACAYNILKNYFYDLSDISFENKQERLVKIGLIFRENKELMQIVNIETKKVIDFIIFENRLNEDDIIIRQFDGFFTPKKLKICDISAVPFRLDEHYHKFIISINRNSYIGKSINGTYIYKGISNLYDGMQKYLQKILDTINFLNISGSFFSLKTIKEEILNSNDIYDFLIPKKKEDGFYVYMNGIGKIEIEPTVIPFLNVNEIDKYSYLNKYIYPFTKSVTSVFLNEGLK
ncbi:MAG: hypothetical protein KatS3mg002_0254 [Candidatus Woesearchaeota archaeon]|nr:MAG: hypothetical protein KatS3mg002_0254 [Candidatus Woesearchaeota archaeon]